jgi:AraC family transcriptional regulator of adaptative response/methylated-DNA-[protein]-cysteine methyltransferase
VREALFAGFRPCKRCRPLEAVGSHPAWVRRLLAQVEEAPEGRITDGVIRALGIEPARARRYFQRSYGMSFHAYCRGRRMAAALQQIRRGDDLDEVIMDSGYESHSGFRDAFFRTFGRAPGQSRDLDCIVVSWIESPLGPLVAGANSKGVCLLEFTDRRMLETQFATLKRRFECAIVPGKNHHVEQLERELRAYFAGTLERFTVPLVAEGTPFEEKVWGELRRIPYGETRSYEDLARAVGTPGGQRAVGHANGCNRIAIVIPCHRVVNKDGRLGGYGGGLWRKQFLLDLERGRRAATAEPVEAGAGAPAPGR